MGRKKDTSDKGRKLSENEKAELSFFMDRLRVQDPQGPSLENCLKSLKHALTGREALAAALMDALSLEGGPVCFRAFCALQGLVQDKHLTRIVRRAAYRFRQKGFILPDTLTAPEASTPIVLVKAEKVKNEGCMIFNDKMGIFHYGAFVHAADEGQTYGVVLLMGAGLADHDLFVAPMSRKHFKEFFRGAAEDSGSRAHEIPLGHLARVLQALAKLDRVPEETKANVAKARKLLEPHALPDARPFFMQLWEQKGLSPLRDVETPDLVDFITRNLSIIPYHAPLFPDKLAFEAEVKALQTITNSAIEVPAHIQSERLLEALRSATRRLLPVKLCGVLGKHLEEMALWWLLVGRDPFEVEKSFALAQHAQKVQDSGSSPVMIRVVEIAMAVYHEFFTDDLLSDLQRFHEHKAAHEEGLERSPTGLYVPRPVLE